jgi:hypothetical protein
MNEKMSDALQTCLQALEKGEALESVLASFPVLEKELRPILEASIRARSLMDSTVPDEVKRRGRLRLLQSVTEMRKVRRSPRRTWLYNFRPLAVVLMLAIFFLSSTGLVSASSVALPGDHLYPVKRTWEGMRLFFTLKNDERQNLEMEYDNERLDETNDLLTEGRAESITFSGYITAQADVQWIISGIPVSITAQTILPSEPVTIGSAVTVYGMTTLDGFVDARSIEVVPAGTLIPTPKPGNEGDGSSLEIESQTDFSSTEKPSHDGTKQPGSDSENDPPENQE